MKLLDKLRSQPDWKSDDPRIRMTAVRDFTDEAQGLLLEIARHDDDLGVRRAAVSRITDVDALVTIARESDSEGVGAEATAVLRELAIDAEDVARGEESVRSLTNERDLAVVARSARLETVRRIALARVTDERWLGSIVRRAADSGVALEALARVQRADELYTIAIKVNDKAIALAAFERLAATDGQLTRDVLEALAARAKQKAVARRARGTLAAMSEAVPTTEPGDDSDVRVHEEQKAAESGVQGITEARAKGLATRRSFCERVELLAGATALDELAALCRVWAELPPLKAGDDGEPAAVQQRFETAGTACVSRHSQRLAALERQRELDGVTKQFEALVSGEESDTEAIRAAWPRLDKVWRKLMVAARVDTEENDADGLSCLASLQKRRDAAGDRRRTLAAKARAGREREEQENLIRVNRLGETLDGVVSSEKLELREAERYLRSARRALEQLPLLPSRRDREAVIRRLRQAHTMLLGRVRELRDFADWQRWANFGVQEEVCRRMEAFVQASATMDDVAVARQFREHMHRWRLAVQVPERQREDLWNRFKTAHDAVFPRFQKHLDQQAVEREGKLERKRALLVEAEQLASSTNWIKAAERITELQRQWRVVGPVPRRDEKELWNRFRKACNGFFARRKADLAKRKKEWAGNLEKKEALCARIEALADPDGLPAAIQAVKQAQADWKTIGPVRRTRSDAVWQRFRAACDGVLDLGQRREHVAAAEKVAVREALCAKLEGLIGQEAPLGRAPDSLRETVRGIQSRWRQAPDVPQALRGKLVARFERAVSRIVEAYPDSFRGTELDPTRILKRLEKLCQRVEDLAPAKSLDESAASPVEILAAKWTETMANNTMGVRVDETALRRTAMEEVKQIRLERRRLGEMTGDEGRRLDERFQRACGRVFQ